MANYLSINYGGHDTSAALMIDGVLVAACEEERYNLEKHTRAFPENAIADCLDIGGIRIDEVDEVSLCADTAFQIREAYLKPALLDDSRIDFMIADIERIKLYRGVVDEVRGLLGYEGPMVQHRHHLCHLASTYYPSGFDESLLLSLDGVGEIETGILATGRGGDIEILHDKTHSPDSLGLLYSALTFFLGWRHHYDEGIIMGLACYGDAENTVPGSDRSYIDVFREIVQETGPYDYVVNRDWISYHRQRDTWVSELFHEMFGEKREYEDELTQHHMDIAAGLQTRLEEVVLSQLEKARDETKLTKLCIAGGVGLNCSMNGAIAASGLFEELFVQPASGDSGTAVGGCYLSEKTHNPALVPAKWHDFYLGSRSTETEIEQAFTDAGVEFTKPDDLYELVARQLEAGLIVGWFQGGSEFGPRALGNRSILARPYPAEMKDHINARVKFREYFRPFAPAALLDHASDYFDIDQHTPHMLIACQAVEERAEEIAAVVHIDNSCRLQTVTADSNAKFHRLLSEFHSLTGCPVLMNTSFNVKGQPIVNTAEQAVASFLSTNIDVLVVGDCYAEKADEDKGQR